MSLKRKTLIGIVLLLAIAILIVFQQYNSEVHKEHLSSRIIYYEGGPYYDYDTTLISLFEGLSQIGFIEPIEIPKFKDRENTKKIWDWLCDNVKGDHITLSKDDYYSSDWDEAIRKTNKEKIYEDIRNPETSIRLIIAMGTWAGLDFANNLHNVNTMVISTTDPIKAGILKDKHDYDLRHVFVEIVADVYYQQLNIFYSIFRFKKLGIAFDNTADGRSYIAYSDVYRVAKEKKFEVIECIFDDFNPDMKQRITDGKACIDELSTKVDAIYLGDQSFLKYEYLSYILGSTYVNKIPTWAHHGVEHVRHGALMSKSYLPEFKRKGVWEAKAFDQIIHGTRPYLVSRVWKDHTELVINLEVANKIGFEVPDALIDISDKVFEHIERSDSSVQELLR